MPWRRHSTTEPQLNSPVEGLSVLSITTTAKPVSAKLRAINLLGQVRATLIPNPHLPQAMSSFSVLPRLPGTWVSNSLRTPQPWPCCRPGDPQTSLSFPPSQTILSHPKGGTPAAWKHNETPWEFCLPGRPCLVAEQSQTRQVPYRLVDCI